MGKSYSQLSIEERTLGDLGAGTAEDRPVVCLSFQPGAGSAHQRLAQGAEGCLGAGDGAASPACAPAFATFIQYSSLNSSLGHACGAGFA